MRYLLACVLLCLSTLNHALTLEGVELPDTLQVQEHTLVLNGAGVRSKYFMDVYVTALYLPEKSQDAEAIIKADTVQSIQLHIISSRITRSRLLESIEDGVKASAGKDFPRYAPTLKELSDAVNFEVKIGDVFEFTYVPGTGIHFYRNGDLLQVLPQFDFKQVLFGIWLGADPVQKSVKQGLLGQ